MRVPYTNPILCKQRVPVKSITEYQIPRTDPWDNIGTIVYPVGGFKY